MAGAYFWSLETVFPHPVSLSAATDMGMFFRVSKIFKIRDDLLSVLASSNHVLRISRPFWEMNSPRKPERVRKITLTTTDLCELFSTFFIIHTSFLMFSFSFTPPSSSSRVSRFFSNRLRSRAAGTAGFAGASACFAFDAFFSCFSFCAAFARAFFVALSLFAGGAAGSCPLG